jgi:hypothetical protein
MGIRPRPTAPCALWHKGHPLPARQIDSSRMCRTSGFRRAENMFDGFEERDLTLLDPARIVSGGWRT